MFVIKMGSTTGVDVVRQRYITRKIKPQGWVASRDSKMDEKRLMYLASIHGPGYNMDNHTVCYEVQNFCIGTTSYGWIREFELNKDGRSAWLALLQ